MKKPQVLAVVGKGGTGKTTTAVNLAYELACLGLHIALVDCDPQASCTQALGQLPVADPFTAAPVQLALGGAPAASDAGAVWLTRGGRTLTSATRTRVLSHLREAGAGADVLVVDTLPAVSPLTLAALSIADVALVALQPAPLPMSGLEDLLDTCRQVNPYARVRALFTLVKPRRTMLSRIQDAINRRHPGLLCPIYIPDDAPCESATAARMPVGRYESRSRSALAYRIVAKTVLGELDDLAFQRVVGAAGPTQSREVSLIDAKEVSHVAP